MARVANRLTDTWLRKAKVGNGIYADGASLYLRIQGNARSWLYIYTDKAGKRREIGLGGYPSISLKIARDRAQECRDLRNKGLDPKQEKDKGKQKDRKAEGEPTFETVALEWIEVNEPRWSSSNTATAFRGYVKNWTTTLNPLPIGQVDKFGVVGTLKPVWGSPLGSYLRNFLERVLDYAMAKDLMPEKPNPARLRGNVDELIKAPPHKTRHHEALPWEAVPQLMTDLAQIHTHVAAALRLTILCALRQGETRDLRWSEVFDDRLVIGASRYKTRKTHTVPLSPQAKAILEARRPRECDPDTLVFPGRLKGRPFSSHEFAKLLTRGTPHGIARSSFVVWAVEAGGFTDDMAQRCLGHVVGSAVSRAYQRSDFFDAKKAIFDAWGEFITTGHVGIAQAR